MQYVETSDKSVQEVIDAIKDIAPKYGFGILGTYNFKATLNSYGYSFSSDCQIVDICSPVVANNFLQADIDIAPALPCKFAVYTKDNTTFIVLSSLLQMIDELNPSLLELALSAQDELLKIMKEAK